LRPDSLRDKVVNSLEALKGQDIVALDVADLTDITDFMVIVSGTSNRHVKAMVDRVVVDLKNVGLPPLGVEGKKSCEWVLVDLGDVLVHVMQRDARSTYELERLWSELPSDSTSLI
tara:strand:- start:1145 stop:1492 length:348 start_codon:yes stop_codon:yes gene_type:complete